MTVVAGNSYRIAFDMTGRTAGSISITLGTVTFSDEGTTSWTAGLPFGADIVAAASGARTLTVTASNDFDGVLTFVTICQGVKTRLYIAPRILLAVQQSCALDEATFRALGFTLSITDTIEGLRIYDYDLATYKTVPDWLNSRYWAHPERWEP